MYHLQSKTLDSILGGAPGLVFFPPAYSWETRALLGYSDTAGLQGVNF